MDNDSNRSQNSHNKYVLLSMPNYPSCSPTNDQINFSKGMQKEQESALSASPDPKFMVLVVVIESVLFSIS